MRSRFPTCLGLAAAIYVAAALSSTATATTSTRASTWSDAVTGICAHAILFEESHDIGTRAGAVAVALDIRASTGRRVGRIRALPVLPPSPRLASRWLLLEERLAAVYAASFVSIYDAIEAATTPEQRADLPGIVQSLLHAPDPLRRKTMRLEQRLHVPDCTGGAEREGGSIMVTGPPQP